MNLTAILADSYRRLGFGTSPDSEVTTRLTEFANQTIKEILSDPILQKARNRTLAFSTIASVSTVALPQAIADIERIVDRVNQFPLIEVDQAWMRSNDPGKLVTSTNPQNWAAINYQSAIARQPADASQILVKSTAAGDTTQTAYIEVVDSNGSLIQASVVLTGTTAVNIGPSDTVDIIDFYLSAAAVGAVTLNEDTGLGTQLTRLPIGATRSRYVVVELFPQPSSVMTLYADCEMNITNLVNGTDEPLIEDEFCEAIIHGVRRREYQKREKADMATAAWKDAMPILARMKHKQHKRTGRSNDSAPNRWSQLGPYYPAGS